MVNNEFIKKMFDLPQASHPERLWALSRLPGKGVIYDMGCGTNKTVEEAIGVDIRPVSNLTGNLDYLPFIEDHTADVIISRHSLEHMLDLVKTLNEWRRILKREGKMIIILPMHGELNTMDGTISAGTHLHAFNMDSFGNLILSLPGFRLDELSVVLDNWSFGAVVGIKHAKNDENELFQVKTDRYLNQITGMMTEGELLWLYDKAKEMDTTVEIGSWMGRSTHALLMGTSGVVYAVDHFNGSADPIETGNRDVYPYFKQNVGHFSNLRVVKKPSLEGVKEFKDKSVDFVFIDGGHQYAEVVADINAWLPKATKLIAVHDYDSPVVKKAVDELLGKGEVVGRIWYKYLNI